MFLATTVVPGEGGIKDRNELMKQGVKTPMSFTRVHGERGRRLDTARGVEGKLPPHRVGPPLGLNLDLREAAERVEGLAPEPVGGQRAQVGEVGNLGRGVGRDHEGNGALSHAVL